MTKKKTIRKQDKSISEFFNGWSEVIQNLPKSTYTDDKIAIVRAVKVLSEEMQDVAKKAGYKPDDVLFITMEKIEGSIVEWQIKNGLVIKKGRLNGSKRK